VFDTLIAGTDGRRYGRMRPWQRSRRSERTACAGTSAHSRRIVDPARRTPGSRAAGLARHPVTHGQRWCMMYPAYITWEQCEQIQEQIAENGQRMQERLTRSRAIRRGAAMLTKLVGGGYCGRAMPAGYRSEEGRNRYACYAHPVEQVQASYQSSPGTLAMKRYRRVPCRSDARGERRSGGRWSRGGGAPPRGYHPPATRIVAS
jgi:hypothetical protein